MLSAMTTELGSAIPCNRAARFGVKPIGDLLHRGSAPGLSGFARPRWQLYPRNPQRSRQRAPASAYRARALADCGVMKSLATAGARPSMRQTGRPEQERASGAKRTSSLRKRNP